MVPRVTMLTGPPSQVHHGDSIHHHLNVHANSPGPSPFSTGSADECEPDGYFDLRPDGASPASIRSNAISLAMPSTPTSTAAALAALQYLPVPVLVLSSTKTVLLANEAMGRLLGIDINALQDAIDGVLSMTDILRGQTMAQLGIDILQHGSPIWISWEVILPPLNPTNRRP
jgi:hypothetical protein